MRPIRTAIGFIGLLILALLVSQAVAQNWEVVGQAGIVRFVYMAPEGLKDKQFVAQVLSTIMRKQIGLNSQTGHWRGAAEILLFDDKRYTPQDFPMTDKQMLHQRARYNYNPNTGFEEFVWVSVVNDKASPPKLKETKADIRPGFAE